MNPVALLSNDMHGCSFMHVLLSLPLSKELVIVISPVRQQVFYLRNFGLRILSSSRKIHNSRSWFILGLTESVNKLRTDLVLVLQWVFLWLSLVMFSRCRLGGAVCPHVRIGHRCLAARVNLCLSVVSHLGVLKSVPLINSCSSWNTSRY